MVKPLKCETDRALRALSSKAPLLAVYVDAVLDTRQNYGWLLRQATLRLSPVEYPALFRYDLGMWDHMGTAL